MIYFIKSLEFVKIGFTNNIKNRFSQLQTSSPVKLEVIGLIEGDLNKEKELHIKFSEFYSNGEWFNLSEVLYIFIENLPKNLMWKYGFLENERSPIGEIKKIRLNEGLTLGDLADRMNISKQSVKEIESREVQGGLTLKSLFKVAKALGYKLEYRLIK